MTSTPVSLLHCLRESPDPTHWARFVDLYAPIVHDWAVRAGLQDADAADLMQEVFTLLLQKLPQFEYDPRKQFRAWLKQVVINVWRGQARRKRPGQLAEGVDPPMPTAVEEFWEVEFRGHLARRAVAVLHRDFAAGTWKAFWGVAIDGRPAGEVASELGLSVGAVYAARFRVLARLRQELEGMLD